MILLALKEWHSRFPGTPTSLDTVIELSILITFKAEHSETPLN